MKKFLSAIVRIPGKYGLQILFFTIPVFMTSFRTMSFGQTNLNGKLDDLGEIGTTTIVPFVMPDGVKLYANITVPVLQDCVIVNFDLGIIDTAYAGFYAPLEVLQRGKQLIIYDSLYGQPNPNPYQLPMIWIRTPYNKGNTDALGAGFGLLGYVFGQQDQRGRYSSEGVYLPIQSDGWSKMPYHPYITHVLDTLTPLSDPRNGNKHEDGYNSIQFIKNNLTRTYDVNGDGILQNDETFLIYNGSIGTMGASALGYNQYQAAAAHKIDPSQPGLKCMIPIVATNEFYKSTGFQNGVFRDRLVTGWIQGQVFDTEDDSIPVDQQIAAAQGALNAVQNNIHSSFDYAVADKFVAANKAIDHFATVRYKDQFGNLLPTGYYPNAVSRKGYDASRAMVDAGGDGSLYGQFSRYANMEVPAYHLTGWWDIFIDGQIQTWAYMKKELSRNYDNYRKQKIVIGPWAHQTIAKKITGDMTYPDNVTDLVGVDFDAFDTDSFQLSKVLKSEPMSWFRYNLNYNQGLGEPKFFLARNNRWQPVLFGLYKVRIPSKDYTVKFETMLSFLNGTGPLHGFPVEVKDAQDTIVFSDTVTVSPLGYSLIPGLDTGKIVPIPRVNFMDSVANVRAYIAGPNGDGIPDNAAVGNYWLNLDTFPVQAPYVNPVKMYLHQNGMADYTNPDSDEGYKIYVHDPNDPVLTIGGENMIVQLPNGAKNLAGTGNSQGQINVANFAQYTMDRPGVLQFTSAVLSDTLSIVGFPVGTLYAKTNPGGLTNGPTDTDFFIRILDVYPNDSDGNRREYFVTEGCVNARARDYARNIVEHPEWDENPPYANDNIPFTNINIGQVYEYKFKMMPIGYTFGKGHKIKILISSSNYTRYQVNPNLPVNDGEFFRRKPGDGQGYVYNGNFMMPRLAVQRLAFSPQYPSNIELPVYVQGYVWAPTFTPEIVKSEAEDFLLFPNPASNEVSVYLSKESDYTFSVTNMAGQLILKTNISNTDEAKIDVKKIPDGIYLFQAMDNKTNRGIVKKLAVVK